VAAHDGVVTEDEAGRLVDLAGVAARVVVEEVVLDHHVLEQAGLEEQRLLGFGVAGDVVGEGDVRAAAEDLPEVLVVVVRAQQAGAEEGVAVDLEIDRRGCLDVIGGW
jgi:hypothetical protein